MIELSIITVTYNDLINLKNTVNSIVSQIDPRIEYLVIDGYSNDGTREYLKNLSGVKWVSEKDSGLYNAMNKGIQCASGKRIWFVNAGDCLLRGSLKKVLSDLEKLDDDVNVVGNIIETFEYGGKTYARKHDAILKLEMLKFGMIFSHQGLLANRDVLCKLHGFDERYKVAADWDLIIRMWKDGSKFHRLDYWICTYDKFGVSYNPHLRERHLIRKKNKLYSVFDYILIKDVIQSLKRLVAQKLLRDKYLELYLHRGFKIFSMESET